MLPVPTNHVIQGDGFYISYNDIDLSIYGCDTTALVFGQMQKFYILNGDHVRQYMEIIHLGFDACFDYFMDNLQDINKNSDKVA